SLADVIAFNDDHATAELDFGDQVVLERALDAGPIDDPGYQDARTTMHRATRQDGIDAVMDAAGVDALIAPTAPVPAEISSYGDPGFVGSSATPAAMAGYPSISIPIGLVGNLPVGMNIFGRAFSERTLLEIAYGCEQILQARVPPSYLPSDPTDDPTPEDVVDEDPASSPEEDPTSDELDPSDLDAGL
ncbi:MAG TPA: amidase family protein, partial [Thermomicrobiales bacterium]|nr:amidase family protein [Thermomicrobiales bacterium]